MTDGNMFLLPMRANGGDAPPAPEPPAYAARPPMLLGCKTEADRGVGRLARAESGGKGIPGPTGLCSRAYFACVSDGVSFDPEAIAALERRVRAKAIALGEIRSVRHGRVVGRAGGYPQPEGLLLFGMRSVADVCLPCAGVGKSDPAVTAFCMRACGPSAPTWAWTSCCLWSSSAARSTSLAAMAALEDANVSAYGRPRPATVELKVEAKPSSWSPATTCTTSSSFWSRPKARRELCTPGEMLPANAYRAAQVSAPERQLRHRVAQPAQGVQGLPAPIISDTSCLLRPDRSYADRVFTTGPVSFPGAHAVGAGEDGARTSRPLSTRRWSWAKLGRWSDLCRHQAAAPASPPDSATTP